MTRQASLRYTQTDDGVDIAYAVVGQGPPVVFADLLLAAGLDVSLTSEAWMQRYAPILDRHSLILFDWRGLGASGSAEGGFSTETLLSDLRAVIEAIGSDRVDLCGAAGLSHVATHYAADHPERVRRLALMNPSLPGSSPRTNPRFRGFLELAETDWERFAELFALTQFGFVDAELARVSRARLMSQLDASRWLELQTAISGLDAHDRGADLQIPTLVISQRDADRAVVTGTRRFVASIPDGRLVGAPNGSDRSSQEHWRMVAEFLDEERGDASEPARVQTVLFTDLAGSTEMHSRLGDEAARTIVRAHDSAVRQAVGAFHGREVKHTGDGIMASFDSAADAVSCALQVRDDLETYNDSHEAEEILIRFGLNAGEPIAEDDDLFGLSVTLASRIGNWGDPGRVLVSDVVRQLLLGKGFAFELAGDAELKGLDGLVAIYEAERASR